MKKLIIIGIILLTIPVYAQQGGDLNCNGWYFEVGDAVLGMRIIADRCGFDSLEQCTIENGDIDNDGNPLTIADVTEIFFVINSSDPPDFSRHPESDTISIGSVDAAPGDVLELPLYVKTIDTLTAFQIAIQTDPDYVTIDTLIVLNSLIFAFSYCEGKIYGLGSDQRLLEGEPVFLLPGEYHIANLILTVNPDIEGPVTTHVEFLNDPETQQYTAFSNVALIIPITVDGEIRITPTGIDDRKPEIVPRDIAIDIYPNPFNGNANITVRSDSGSELVIYDIMGRAVRRFPVDEGLNQFDWDATNDYGERLGSGVFFAKINNAPARYSKKIVYLK
ncbi:MAG: T9SS type A sorting domain-containing protein [candidate division Zixibacteria bacterium]